VPLPERLFLKGGGAAALAGGAMAAPCVGDRGLAQTASAPKVMASESANGGGAELVKATTTPDHDGRQADRVAQ